VKRATLLLHGGRSERITDARDHSPLETPVETPLETPLVSALEQAVSSPMPAGAPPSLVHGIPYARYANSAQATRLSRRLAELEGTDAALVLASGMAATTCTMSALLRTGDHLIASAWLYGGTRTFIERELPGMGVDVTLVDPTETRTWRKALRDTTRVLFLESPVNPTTRVVDVSPARTLAHELGIALVIDATFASPINWRPVDDGADVVIHSATKYLNGHHDVLAGVVCASESLIEEVRAKMALWGAAPDPFALWLLERGLKTLDVRVTRQNASAHRVAEWASQQSTLSRVWYPGLTSHPDHALAARTLRGFGGIVTLTCAGGGEVATRVVESLRLFAHATSLGGVDSLVSEPRYTSHRHLTPTQRADIGIPDGTLRLSIGLEDVDDLIDDLAQAIARATGTTPPGTTALEAHR
jgi:cystathionine beta-lyase/cystathionine gamma-synthase